MNQRKSVNTTTGCTLVHSRAARTRVLTAFTLVELLVVIGIIALLVGLLIPVLNKVRIKGYTADSQNFLRQLDAAIVQYQNDFHSYPGPLRNESLDTQFIGTPSPQIFASVPTPLGYKPLAFDVQNFTGAENLVLGLCGGLHVDTVNNRIVYDPSSVGTGPSSLNSLNNAAAAPKTYPPYLSPVNLSWHTDPATGLKVGFFMDDAGKATDSVIPEFVDRYPSPMPILYLRAKAGDIADAAVATSAFNNNIVCHFAGGDSTPPAAQHGQYSLNQIIGYTASGIGAGRIITTGDYLNAGTLGFPKHGLQSVDPTRVLSRDKTNTNAQYPYDAFAYFSNPNVPNSPRAKDTYILISAGPDRVYGTDDDITSFGAVNP